MSGYKVGDVPLIKLPRLYNLVSTVHNSWVPPFLTVGTDVDCVTWGRRRIPLRRRQGWPWRHQAHAVILLCAVVISTRSRSVLLSRCVRAWCWPPVKHRLCNNTTVSLSRVCFVQTRHIEECRLRHKHHVGSSVREMTDTHHLLDDSYGHWPCSTYYVPDPWLTDMSHHWGSQFQTLLYCTSTVCWALGWTPTDLLQLNYSLIVYQIKSYAFSPFIGVDSECGCCLYTYHRYSILRVRKL